MRAEGQGRGTGDEHPRNYERVNCSSKDSPALIILAVCKQIQHLVTFWHNQIQGCVTML